MKVNIVCLLVFVHLCVARQCAARKGTRMHKTLTSLLRRLAKCRTSKEKKGRPQRRRPPQRGVTVQYPGLKREVKSRPASLSCDVGLLMASASRSRAESCSGEQKNEFEITKKKKKRQACAVEQKCKELTLAHNRSKEKENARVDAP